jgi:AcrR family transcriptional regulator
MNMTHRTYKMRARAEAVEATRERIARAAMVRFFAEPYEDVTIASVAADAKVSHQTVLNHFESKEGLFTAAAELFGAEEEERRSQGVPRDTESAVALLMGQYEVSGEGNVRLAALDGRIDAVTAALAGGRANHEAWLAEVFGARLPRNGAEKRRALGALYAATDVHTWKLLRRDLGHGRRATQQIMTSMVTAIVDSWPAREEKQR